MDVDQLLERQPRVTRLDALQCEVKAANLAKVVHIVDKEDRHAASRAGRAILANVLLGDLREGDE